MDIIDLVNDGICQLNVTAKNKENLLFKVAALFSEKFHDIPAEEIYRGLMEREKLGSTGFGDGLAIPHAKSDYVDSFGIVMVTLKKGVEFGSLDKKKVKIVIAILGPSGQQKEYLRLLAKLSKSLRGKNTLAEMAAAKGEDALKEALLKSAITLEGARVEEQKKKLLVINLSEIKFFHDILNHLLEKEISNVVISESEGIESHLADSPLFGGFLNFLAERTGSCKTIMVPVTEKELTMITEEIEEIMGDLNTHGGVQLLALDISFMKGAL